MLRKLRYTIPAAQMALAFALHWMSWRWMKAVIKLGTDSPGTNIYFTLCVAINAPVAMIRAPIARVLEGYWDPVLFILGTGLLWYWVMRNIEKWTERKDIVMFQALPLRFLGDIFLILIGGIWAYLLTLDFLRGWPGLLNFSSSLLTPWQVVAGKLIVRFLLFGWAFLLIAVFGYDIIRTIRGLRRMPAAT
jgi:hypothetical protein